jgi:hypothetical protein
MLVAGSRVDRNASSTDPECPQQCITIFLGRRRNVRSPLRRAIHDNRNNHRAETEAGLRRIGRPSRGRNAVTPPIPSSAETTACPNGTGAHRGGHGERWLGLFEQFPGLSKWEPLPGLGRRE